MTKKTKAIGARLGTGVAAELIAIAVIAGGVLAGCVERDGDAAPPVASRSGDAGATAGDAAVPEVLATVDGDEITLADVRARVGERLDQLEHSYRSNRHNLIEEALQQMLQDRLLGEEARRRGMNINELVAEQTGESLDISEADIQAWYDANQSRVRGSVDQIRGQIVELLQNQRREAAVDALQDSLEAQHEVGYFLEPYRVALDNAGAPAKGPENAPVTLVEFSDFECPFCKRFAPTLGQLEEAYGDRLRIVYRQFPLTNLHPAAFKAAEASLCAGDQGSFWELHDLMFLESDRLTVRDLKEKAARLGLDQQAFDSCLDTGRYVEQVQNDLAAGRSVGVTGTPALFVNGIPVEGGAVPYETVAEVIDEELERVGG